MLYIIVYNLWVVETQPFSPELTGVLIWRYGAACCTIEIIAAPEHENAAPEAYDLRGVADAYFCARTCHGAGPHHL